MVTFHSILAVYVIPGQRVTGTRICVETFARVMTNDDDDDNNRHHHLAPKKKKTFFSGECGFVLIERNTNLFGFEARADFLKTNKIQLLKIRVASSAKKTARLGRN